MFVEYKSYLERRAKDPLLKKSTEKAHTQIPLLGICFCDFAENETESVLYRKRTYSPAR